MTLAGKIVPLAVGTLSSVTHLELMSHAVRRNADPGRTAVSPRPNSTL